MKKLIKVGQMPKGTLKQAQARVTVEAVANSNKWAVLTNILVQQGAPMDAKVTEFFGEQTQEFLWNIEWWEFEIDEDNIWRNGA